MILSLESSLAPDIRHTFKFFFKITMTAVTVLYISFGVCGYLSFGPDTEQIITLNLPIGYGFDFAMVVKSCLCLALFFTYPVMMFPVVQLMESKACKSAGENMWRGNALRTVMVIVTGVTVLAIPNFADLIGLVGATCCTMLAFIMPGLFHMKIFKGSLTKGEFCLDVLLIVIGLIGAFIGTSDALARLHETHTGGAEEEEVLAAVNATAIPVLTSSMATINRTIASFTIQNVTSLPAPLTSLLDPVTSLSNISGVASQSALPGTVAKVVENLLVSLGNHSSNSTT